jgi:hypothetical protein
MRTRTSGGVAGASGRPLPPMPIWGLKKLAGVSAAMVEPVFGQLAAEGVAVNAQSFRGTGLVAVVAIQNPLYEAFFKFPHRFVEENAALHHL